jgi:hypothetical protein
MRRLDELLVVADGQALRIGKRLLEAGGKFVQTHGISPGKLSLD